MYTTYNEKIKGNVDSNKIIKKFLPSIKLYKSGKNTKIKCPFHSSDKTSDGKEKTPSLILNEDNSYFCFGCGEYGQIYEILEKELRIPRVQAIKILANELGISLEFNYDSEEFRDYKETKANQNKRYFVNLRKNSKALKYLVNERKLRQDVIKKFALGYVPEDEYKYRDDISNIIGRISFPIYEPKYKKPSTLGIGYGAIERDDNNVKYINDENQEPFFIKSDLLYGYRLAAKAIKEKDEAIITEGYFDVISMHQSGFENVVGTMTDKISDNQLTLLSKLTDNITLFYDGDSPGINAMIKMIPKIYKFGFKVNIIIMNGYDPDDYCKKYNFDHEVLKKEFELNKEVGIQKLISLETNEFQRYIFNKRKDIITKFSPIFDFIEDETLKQMYEKELMKKLEM